MGRRETEFKEEQRAYAQSNHDVHNAAGPTAPAQGLTLMGIEFFD